MKRLRAAVVTAMFGLIAASPAFALDSARAGNYWDFPVHDVQSAYVHLYLPDNAQYITTAQNQITSWLWIATVPGSGQVYDGTGTNEYFNGRYYDDIFVFYTDTSGAQYYETVGDGKQTYGHHALLDLWRTSKGTNTSNWTGETYDYNTSTGYSYSFTTQDTDIATNSAEVTNFETCTDSVNAEWWSFVFENDAGSWYYEGNTWVTNSDPNASCTSIQGHVSGTCCSSNPFYTAVY